MAVAVPVGLVALTTVGPAAFAQPAGGALGLTKSASPLVDLQSGDTVSYTFVVTNLGSTPVSDIEVTETVFSGSGGAPGITCPSESLQPGRSMTCSATYEITDADQEACLVDNTAVATGTDPQSMSVTSPPAAARVVTDCGAGGGSAELPGTGSLEPGEPGEPGEFGSADLAPLLGSAALDGSALGSPALGSLVLGALGAGSLGAGTLAALGALYAWALGTPYQPGPGAPPPPPPLPLPPGSVAPPPA